MKKIAIFITAFLFVAYSSVKADVILGISAAAHSIDASGTETLRSSGKKTNGGHDESAIVPEIFIEAADDNGFAMAKPLSSAASIKISGTIADSSCPPLVFLPLERSVSVPLASMLCAAAEIPRITSAFTLE